MKPISEAAFETVIEAQLLDNGYYVRVPGDGFDRERAIFPDVVVIGVPEVVGTC